MSLTATALKLGDRGQYWKRIFPLTWLKALAVPWTIVLIAGSLMGESAKEQIGTHSFHRAYHLGSFGSTVSLYMLIARTVAGELRAALAAMALGITIEALQHWIYGSVMEWWDVRDDAIGICVALLLFRMISRIVNARLVST